MSDKLVEAKTKTPKDIDQKFFDVMGSTPVRRAKRTTKKVKTDAQGTTS